MRRLVASAIVLPLLLGVAGCKSTKKEDKLLQELADLDKETIYARAEALFQSKKYSDARRHFSFIYDTFPNDPLGHKAALRVADTYAVKTDSVNQTEARLRYKDFVNRYPNDPDRDYALLMLGQTHAKVTPRADRDLAPIREALDAYEQLVNLYPESPHVAEARQRMGVLREALAEHEWLVAEYYSRNKRWRGALWRLEYIVETYPEYSKLELVQALMAEVQKRLEEREALIEELKQKHSNLNED